MPGKHEGRVPSYPPLLLILIMAFASFPVHAINGQGASRDLQLTTPLQISTQTTQQATQACLTPSQADVSTVQMQATSTNGTIVDNVIPDVRAGKAVQKGRMPGDFTLRFELVFKLRNSDQFYKCLESITDPSSPNYGNFLDATMLQPYIPTPGQKLSVVSYLSSMGMTVTDGASPLTLEISAPVRIVEKALGVRMNVYAKNMNSGFYAADSDPMMPQNFASILDGVLGLENYTRPMPAEGPCSGPYCPQGIQVGYSLSSLYGNGYDGTGQKVAIVDVPGDQNIQSTINTYSSRYGLTPTTLDIRYPDGAPSSYDRGWAVETALDVEAVRAVASGATIVLLYDQLSLMNAIDYVATNHLAAVVSNSWTYACAGPSACSDSQLSPSFVSSLHNRLALDAAQGLTILFASGDEGARPDGTDLGTEFPASDPNVLAVGGTNLALSGCGSTTCSGYAGETGALISGGGYSGYFAEPSWQTSTIGARPGRAVPDVSMLGQNPYFWTYLTGSGWFGAYGTSLSTPLWAGFLAIALQIKGSGSFGNLGPTLYQVANSPSYPSIFHDVTSGLNGYSAGPGWDPVTGWGTPIANLLAPALVTFGARAGVSQPYVLGFEVSDVHSGSVTGDYSYSSTGWSASDASFQVTLGAGESIFLIGTAQVWNDYSSIGSSIAITRDGARVSGDMFAAGATITSRELAAAVAIDTPDAGDHTYALSAKTDPGGKAWISQPYILGFKVSNVYSDSHTGDFSYTTTGWSESPASFQVTLAAGESLFLIGTAQVWNDYGSIGSSIGITRDGVTLVSGDMFAAGATITSRELASAVAVDTPGAGSFTYSLSAKTDPGGKAWISQPYLLAFKVPNVYSSAVAGDYFYSSKSWSPTQAGFDAAFGSGESMFIIGTSQLWNDYSNVGSSIAITQGDVRVSGDMFAAGATISHRELAVAIAVSTPGAGTWTYSLSAKTD